MKPKDVSNPGIILEFKSSNSFKTLVSLANEALMQIKQKQYDTDMKDRGIQNVVEYGIAFCGKTVEVAM